MLLFVYVGFDVLMASLFWLDPNRSGVQSVTATLFIAAGVVSLALGLMLPRRGRALRRFIIGLETLLIPLQVVISVLSILVNLGIVLSIVILVLQRSMFPKPPNR